MSRPRPSVREGVRTAARAWRLVLAVWLVPWLLLAPLAVGWRRTVAGAVAELPPAAPRNEALLLILDALREGVGFQLLLLAVAFLGTWLWTVLWHAGLVQWRVWASDRRAALAPLLGLGLQRGFAYLRLSLAAVAAIGLLGFGLWVAVGAAASAAYGAMAETALTRLVLAGLAGSVLIVLVGWLSVLRGAWLLALPTRRSAVVALGAGLAGTARQPLASLGVLALFAVPGAALEAAPVLAGIAVPALRAGADAMLLAAACGAAAAFLWVALLAAFAPVTGLLEPRERIGAPPAGELSPPAAAA